MKGYRQLTLSERYEIFALKKAGHNQVAIADLVGVHASTVSRALRRNKSQTGYYAQAAHRHAQQRRLQSRGPTKWTMRYQRLIESKLRQQWSPEQIADWLGQTQRVSFSHERIYQYLRADQQAGGLWHKQLRRRLGLRRARRSTLYKGKITQRVSINQRPAIVDDKSRIGDWEADLMLGGQGGGALLTVVERKSRFTCMARLPSKQSEVVADALIEILRPYKKQVETVTVDNGNEFAQHVSVGKALQASVYFAHTYGAWQRGLSENTNGLLRQYFPKGINFKTVSRAKLDQIQKRLNQRPRKGLGFSTPQQIFQPERS
jgi:IS30 family transposase